MTANATNPMVRPLAAALAALALCGACSSPKKAENAADRAVSATSKAPVEAVAKPWPTTFQRECVLAAAKVEISGPKGLIEHLAIRQDSLNHAHTETATPEGLRIVESHKPESDQSPIRAQLDGLVIVADELLVVLESPTAEKLVIEASGDAYFRYVDSGEERRARVLRLEGDQ